MSKAKKIFSSLGRLLGRYKYIITVILGLLWVCLLDEYSWSERIRLHSRINVLNDEYAELARENERDSLLLDDLKRHPKAYERVARERYFMKAPKEDVFVLSDE